VGTILILPGVGLAWYGKASLRLLFLFMLLGFIPTDKGKSIGVKRKLLAMNL
jgi:hypothetical protein